MVGRALRSRQEDEGGNYLKLSLMYQRWDIDSLRFRWRIQCHSLSVDDINGRKTDKHYSSLQWLTNQENVAKALGTTTIVSIVDIPSK